MFEETSWFQSLKALGRIRGAVTFTQFNQRLPTAIADPEQIEKVMQQLKNLGIEVVPDKEGGL